GSGFPAVAVQAGDHGLAVVRRIEQFAGAWAADAVVKRFRTQVIASWVCSLTALCDVGVLRGQPAALDFGNPSEGLRSLSLQLRFQPARANPVSLWAGVFSVSQSSRGRTAFLHRVADSDCADLRRARSTLARKSDSLFRGLSGHGTSGGNFL